MFVIKYLQSKWGRTLFPQIVYCRKNTIPKYEFYQLKHQTAVGQVKKPCKAKWVKPTAMAEPCTYVEPNVFSQ